MSDQPIPTPAPPPVEIEERAEKVAEHAQQLARQPKTLRDLVRGEDFLKAVAEIGPKVMRPARFVRVALTAMTKRPQLNECTRESFFMCMLDCAFYGIEPDGRRAHLIPFRNRKSNTTDCQLIIDYKGLAELVLRSGDVSFMHADAVYPDDEFDVSYGTGGHLIHKPGEERTGLPKKFYSYVRMKDGTENFDVMTLAEVEKVRKRSKSPDEGPWKTDFSEMGKKTVFRRHSKWLPLSPETRFNIERAEPDDIPATNTWTELIEGGEQPQPQRLSAREKILAPVGPEEGSNEPNGN